MTADYPFPKDALLRVACMCGHVNVYESIDAYEADGGDLHYISRQDLFTACCPSCEEARPVKTGVFNYDDGPDEVCVVFGAFEEGYTPLAEDSTAEYDPTRTVFPALDPLKLGQQRMDPGCPECHAPLTEEDLKSGPDAPELGWEYYECSACGNRMRPGAVE